MGHGRDQWQIPEAFLISCVLQRKDEVSPNVYMILYCFLYFSSNYKFFTLYLGGHRISNNHPEGLSSTKVPLCLPVRLMAGGGAGGDV